MNADTSEQEPRNNNETANSNSNEVNSNYPHGGARAVEVTLGELLAEGGFSAVYELSAIKDEVSGEWILAPPPKPKGDHSRGHSAIAFGSSPRRSSQTTAKHQHPHSTTSATGSITSSAQGINSLSPVISSVPLTVLSDFISPTEEENAMITNIAPTTRSSFRFGSPNQEKKKRKRPQYVFKCLKASAFRRGEQVLQQGLKDMHVEAETLQRLSHPHILPLRAVGTMELEHFLDHSRGHASSSSSSDYDHDNNKRGKNGGYGSNDNKRARIPLLILDRLVETLDDKLDYWETKHQKNSSLVGKVVTHRNHDRSSFYEQERLQHIIDIGSAIQYLHKNQ